METFRLGGSSVVIAVLLAINCSAQNLIPNGSFEKFSKCPDQPSQIKFCGWISLFKLYDTADFYYACNCEKKRAFCTPNTNLVDYQVPYDGKGFVGMICPHKSKSSFQTKGEFIQTKLDTTLTKGKEYKVVIQVNLSNGSSYAHDCMGAYLSTKRLSFPNTRIYYSREILPQIENPRGRIIKDTLNWTEISSTFIAKGNERYITIGCFLKDEDIQVVKLNKNKNGTYYYIDGVELFPTDTLDYEIEPVEKLKKFTLFDLRFETNSAEIVNGTDSGIIALANYLNTHQNQTVKLIGHTDNVGDSLANINLSERRVHEVQKFLIDRGIDHSRIETDAKGAIEPIADNKTEKGRRLNRRVEFVLIEEKRAIGEDDAKRK